MSTFVTPESITATFVTNGAEVRIIASERADTVVQVGGTAAAHTSVDFADGELTIKNKKAGADITVELPAGSRLRLSTAMTNVHVDGPLGDCTVDIAEGQVQLDQVAALRGNPASGSVAVGHVAGGVDLDAGTAGLSIGEVAGTVRYQGANGEVSIGHAHSDVDIKAADCPIRIGRLAGGRAELMNAAGGIEVGIGAGVAAEVDADSTKGAVHNSVPAEGGAGQVKVYARTRRGDIVLHPVTV